MSARPIAILAVLVVVATSCGDGNDETTTETLNACGREAQVFDEAALSAGGTPCLGDTLMLGLGGNTDVGAAPNAVEFSVEIPRSGRVHLCLDLKDQPHHLDLADARGQEHELTGPGCADVDVAAGVHSVRITNGRPAAADAKGHLLFIHPSGELSGGAGGGAAESGLLGGIIASGDCPGCDLHGVDWSGIYMICGDVASDDPTNCTTLRKADANVYYSGNNFSGANFGGANFNGATLLSVNFRGAQFSDTTHGPTSMQTARNFELQVVPTTLDTSDFTGASFQQVDLRQANFTCFYFGQLQDYVYDPSTNLSGVDLRGANLAAVDFSPPKCIDFAGPFTPLDFTGAIADATTNLTGTNFSSADLSYWDMRQAHWTDAIFKSVPAYPGGPVVHTILRHAIFDGIDFTKAPYNTIFVSGANSNGILAGADLSQATFVGATLTNAVIEHTIFRARFTKANLQSATFVQTDLRGTDFTYANLQKAQLPNVFLGVSDEQYTQDATLAANLSFAYMPGAKLDHADLRHANLSYVHLYGTPATVAGALMGNANFNGAILSGLIFTGAQLQNTNFLAAQLVGCPFNSADVTGAHFESAHLEGADFTGANMASAYLTNAALSRRGDYQSYTNQVLVYSNGVWTCKPTSSQTWCGKTQGTWSYTEQNGIPYTILFNETVLTAKSTTTCPDALNTNNCTTVAELTPINPPFPPVPDCVPSATNWCTPAPGTGQ